MIKALKKLSSMEDSSYDGTYYINRYWHPDSKKGVDLHIQEVDTLEEAQEICGADEASHKEGPTSEWWFLGYTKSGSRSSRITLWGKQ